MKYRIFATPTYRTNGGQAVEQEFTGAELRSLQNTLDVLNRWSGYAYNDPEQYQSVGQMACEDEQGYRFEFFAPFTRKIVEADITINSLPSVKEKSEIEI